MTVHWHEKTRRTTARPVGAATLRSLRTEATRKLAVYFASLTVLSSFEL